MISFRIQRINMAFRTSEIIASHLENNYVLKFKFNLNVNFLFII